MGNCKIISAYKSMKMHKVKYIKQRDEDDCGIACLAMLSLGKHTYHDARKALQFTKEAECFLTNNKAMKEGLDRLGIQHALRFSGIRSKSWTSIIDRGSVLLVGCGKRKDKDWHWVVYDGRVRRVFDPNPKLGIYIPNRRHKKPFTKLEIFP